LLAAAPLPVLYLDAQVVVVDKPSGLLTHRTQLAKDSDVAMMRVRDQLGRYVYPAHRLDRGTSGALAFALSEDAARVLRQAFDEGEVDKTYFAIVRGVFPERVSVDYAIPKSEGGPRVDAQTAFRRLGTRVVDEVAFSWVEARPVTGRYHQVRRHLAHLRFPIAGDSNYGTGWFNRFARTTLALPRLALHAWRLVIPRVGVDVTAALPPDLARACGEALLEPGDAQPRLG
jgi:tRNA pseudouridine65 synthase